MALYVDSNASGANDGTSWVDAYETGLTCLNAWRATALGMLPSLYTEEVHWASDSSESYAGGGTVILGSAQGYNPVKVILVNKLTGDYVKPDSSSPVQYNLASGFSLGGPSESINLSGFSLRTTALYITSSPGGECVVKDMHFEQSGNWASGLDVRGPGEVYLEGCFLDLGSRPSVSLVKASITSHTLKILRSVISCTNNLPVIEVSSFSNDVLFEDCEIVDFGGSAIGLVIPPAAPAPNSTAYRRIIKFINCKLPAGFSMSSGAINDSTEVQVLGCSTSSDVHLDRKAKMQGNVDTSTEVTFNGGFEIAEGFKLSQYITPLPSCSHHKPIDSFNIVGYVGTTGNTTFIVEMLENFISPLTFRELRAELSYRDTLTKVSRKVESSSLLSSGSGLSSWSGDTAGYRSVKVEVSVNVEVTGMYEITVLLGKYEASGRVYINPEAL